LRALVRLVVGPVVLASLVVCSVAEAGGAPEPPPATPPKPPHVENTQAFLELDQGIVGGRYVSPATIDNTRLIEAARHRMVLYQAGNVDALVDGCLASDQAGIDRERAALKKFLADWRVRKFDVRAAKSLPQEGKVEVWTVVLKENDTRMVRDALRAVWVHEKDGWRVECGARTGP